MPIDNPNFHVNDAGRQITISGEFDIVTARCLATAVAGIQDAALGDITILLDDVTFIDSAGLDAVVDAADTQAERGAGLGVTGANAKVRRIFGLSHLNGLLHAC